MKIISLFLVLWVIIFHYLAEPGKQVTFIGGKAIKGFEKVNDKLWKTKIPEVPLYKLQFEQLYINGNRAVRARTPNAGEFIDVEEVEETVFAQGNGKVADFAVQKIKAGKELLADEMVEKNENQD